MAIAAAYHGLRDFLCDVQPGNGRLGRDLSESEAYSGVHQGFALVTPMQLTISSRRDIAVLRKESSSLEGKEDVKGSETTYRE
jgi:hypothetical protein